MQISPISYCLNTYTPYIHTLGYIHAVFPFLHLPFYSRNSKYYILHTPFISSYFITAQTAFHHTTFSFIDAHFVHHCTLKQAQVYILA